MNKQQEDDFKLTMLRKIGAWVEINGQPKGREDMDKLLDFFLREGVKLGGNPNDMPRLVNELAAEVKEIIQAKGKMVVKGKGL